MCVGVAEHLAREFCRSIGRNRPKVCLAFGKRRAARCPVNRAGRTEYEFLDLKFAAEFEKVYSAGDVDALVETWFFDRRPNAGTRREVDDGVRPKCPEDCTKP